MARRCLPKLAGTAWQPRNGLNSGAGLAETCRMARDVAGGACPSYHRVALYFSGSGRTNGCAGMTRTRPADLADYRKPPVIEVVCGVQFEPLEKLSAPLVGVFWQGLRDTYPTTQAMPVLVPQFEAFPSKGSVSLAWGVVDVPPLPRSFFIGGEGEENWLMQLQADRFLHNWRRIKPEDEYPHFETVFEKFWNNWLRFQEFCATEAVGSPAVTQLEVTYINHVPAGNGWSRVSEVGNVFPEFNWRATDRFLPEPDSLSWKASFVLPEQQGRLRVSVNHALRKDDDEGVLLCELTCRGVPPSPDNQSIEDWFFLGRKWIVNAFDDITASDIQQQVWEKIT